MEEEDRNLTDSLNRSSSEDVQNESADKMDESEEYKANDFEETKVENKPEVNDSLNKNLTEDVQNETANKNVPNEEYKNKDSDKAQFESEPDETGSSNINTTEGVQNETADKNETSGEYRKEDSEETTFENKPDVTDSFNISPTENEQNERADENDIIKEYKKNDSEESTFRKEPYGNDPLNISPTEGAKSEITDVNKTSEEYKKKRPKEISYTPFIGLLSAVLILFGAVVIQLKSDTDYNQKSKFSIYLRDVENLKSNYGQQSETFWNNILSFPYFLLSEENPESPAVLLIVAPAGRLNLALHLTEQLANILHKLLNSSSKDLHIVNGTLLTLENPDDQKLMIDEGIRTLVEDQEQKVVVVVNLEKIDPNAVMIFHAYCDNSEAIYKDIAIIFLLELPPGVYAKNNGHVYSYLSRIWSRLGKSRYQALFSRMANNIIIMSTRDFNE